MNMSCRIKHTILLGEVGRLKFCLCTVFEPIIPNLKKIKQIAELREVDCSLPAFCKKITRKNQRSFSKKTDDDRSDN